MLICFFLLFLFVVKCVFNKFIIAFWLVFKIIEFYHFSCQFQWAQIPVWVFIWCVSFWHRKFLTLFLLVITCFLGLCLFFTLIEVFKCRVVGFCHSCIVCKVRGGNHVTVLNITLTLLTGIICLIKLPIICWCLGFRIWSVFPF